MSATNNELADDPFFCNAWQAKRQPKYSLPAVDGDIFNGRLVTFSTAVQIRFSDKW